MSSLLAWQSGKHSHRQQLHQFVCTDVHPARRARNWRDGLDRWWEYEVQSMIRALEPPYRNGRHLRIGSDEQGLAAVSLLEELDGPDLVEMRVGAIAVRHRHKGGGYADEMFRDSLDLVTENAAAMEVREVTVVGHVWEANRPSQDLCRRHGFIHTGDGGKGVQQWTATFSTLLDE